MNAFTWIKKVLGIGLVLFALPVVAQQADVDTVYKRLLKTELSRTYDASKVKSWVATLKSDGTWPDINYLVTNTVPQSYSPINHLERTRSMALAYVKTGDASLYRSTALLAKIRLALNNNLGRPHDEFFNWNHDWYATYIAYPESYISSLLLLKGQITKTELLKYSVQMKDGLTQKSADGKSMQFEDKGENLIWVAHNSIIKGCVEDQFATINTAFTWMNTTLNLMEGTGEGIKRDYAFHQHGSQLYSGGYGLWFIGDIVNHIELSNGTTFRPAWTVAGVQRFADLVLQGHQWLTYKNNMDFGSVGRNISRNNSTGAMGTWILDKMATLDPSRATQYLAFKAHRNGGAFAYSGNRHFWKTDFMAQRGPTYYLSAKVISKRTIGTENMNEENITGYNLPLGSTNINTRGGEYNNIYPVWDFSRIPGTTTEMGVTYESPATFLGLNDFGGGVSSGNAGVLSFHGAYQSIKTYKSYFFMGDAMFCMGAGITATKTNSVVTSVNQSYLNGIVTVNNGSSVAQTVAGMTYTNLKWAQHDGVGYIFPGGGTVTVQQKQQTGSWSRIGTGDATPKAYDVFSLWLDHGKTPNNSTYQYIVVPNQSPAQMTTLSTSHGFLVNRNDTLAQSVSNTALGKHGIVFYKASSVTLAGGLVVSTDKPAIVLIENATSGLVISVADPLYLAGNTITVNVNRAYTGPGATALATGTKIIVTMPTGNDIGKTMKNLYAIVIKLSSSSTAPSSSSSRALSSMASSSAKAPSSSSSLIPLSSSSVSGPVSNVRVTPNPIYQQGDVYFNWVQSTRPRILQFQVMDARGQIVRRWDDQNIFPGANRVWIKDVHQLGVGNYMLEIRNGTITIGKTVFSKL